MLVFYAFCLEHGICPHIEKQHFIVPIIIFMQLLQPYFKAFYEYYPI